LQVNGRLPTNPQITFSQPGWVLRLAIGDYNNDGFLDIASANNGQLSGDRSCILVYPNNNGILDTIPAFTLLTNTRYSSCLSFGDLNGDGYLELACGGWWEPICVFENFSGSYLPTPQWSYNWGRNLVCENIMFGCLANNHLRDTTEIRIGNNERRLFNLKKVPFQRLNSIYVGERRLAENEYTFDYLTGYVTFAFTPNMGETIRINYTYSPYGDLGVTNWDRESGNLLFLNTALPAVKEIVYERNKAKGIYNIFGQKIKKLSKGIYFVNGKKYLLLR
jgi:hypothetical protein